MSTPPAGDPGDAGVSAPELNCHREGRGRPLLLLHGVGHHWQAFRPVIGRLAAGGFQVTAVDLPGFGGSPPLEGDDLSIPAYARAVAAWIRAQGGEPPAVVGNSMGGAIALELARRGIVAAAVAVSPAGFWTDAERRYTQLTLETTRAVPAALRPLMLRAIPSGPGRALLLPYYARPWRVPAHELRAGLRNAWSSPAFRGAVAAFSRYRFPDPASPAPGDPPPAPMSVLWGTRDLLLPYALQAPRARRELPSARHVTLPGLGHVPFPDDPGMVAQVILGVLGPLTPAR